MKKSYIAPNVKYSANSSLEGVFASLDECGNERTFNVKGSGIITMKSYCHSANTWMISIDNNDLYGEDFIDKE